MTISACEAAILYGNILAKMQVSRGSANTGSGRFRDLILRIQEIKLPISAFLRPVTLTLGEFQREWAIMQWEAAGGFNNSRFQGVQAHLNAFNVQDAPCQLVRTTLLSCITIQGEMLLVMLQGVDGRATVRAKGSSLEVVRGVVGAVGAL